MLGRGYWFYPHFIGEYWGESKYYPIADALLLDRLGAYKLESGKIDSNAPVNPLYVKRDVEKRA